MLPVGCGPYTDQFGEGEPLPHHLPHRGHEAIRIVLVNSVVEPKR
jgi:hypothetical protein